MFNEGTTKASPIDLDKVTVTKQMDETPWADPALGLGSHDRLRLVDGLWLSEKHIRAANTLLKSAYPNQAGLFDTVNLLQTASHSATYDSSLFVQILHINSCHWVCVSNNNCAPATVDVFDSMLSVSSKVLEKQVAAVARCREQELTIRYIDVQQQEGGEECGLFAVAFARHLCSGGDPHTLALEQAAMCDHFAQCLEDGELLPFPHAHTGRLLGRRRRRLERIKVYCMCRLPWDKHDTARGNLAQCRLCKEWFHQQCAAISETVFLDTTVGWQCSSCTTL